MELGLLNCSLIQTLTRFAVCGSIYQLLLDNKVFVFPVSVPFTQSVYSWRAVTRGHNSSWLSHWPLITLSPDISYELLCVIIILYHCVCGVRGPTGGHQLRAGAEHGAVCTVQPVQTGTVHCTHCTHGHQVDTIIAPIHIHNWQCSMCSSSSSHCHKSFVSFDRLTLICGQLLPWDRKKIINLIIM